MIAIGLEGTDGDAIERSVKGAARGKGSERPHITHYSSSHTGVVVALTGASMGLDRGGLSAEALEAQF